MRSIMLPQNIIEWEPLHNGCCVIAELIGSLVLPVAVRPKAWVCGRSLAGNVGSNPAGSMVVCMLLVSCVVR